MALDYALPPESPLLRPGVIGRIYWGPALGFGEESVCIEDSVHMAQRLARERLGPYPVRHTRIQSRPMMTWEEAAALLTFPGLVWFVSEVVDGDEPARTASLVDAGLPWPLWRTVDWQRMLLNVTSTQGTFLKTVFRPAAPLAVEHWSDLAQKTGQDVAFVQEAKSSLHSYIDCLTSYWRLTAVWNN